MDIYKHGEPAYPNAAQGHGWENEGHMTMSRKPKVEPNPKFHYFFIANLNKRPYYANGGYETDETHDKS